MKRYIKDNKVKLRKEIIICRKGVQVINPTEEMLLADGWSEYLLPQTEPLKPTYQERVEQLIRERYTSNQELAIQRQRDTKPSEFDEYFAYCEECKRISKNKE